MASPHRDPSDRPASTHSTHTANSRRSQASKASEETTPLLSRQDDDDQHSYTDLANGAASPATASLQSIQGRADGKSKSRRRWPTVIALSVLCLLVLVVLGVGFAVPAVVEEYAKEALVVTPTSLSIDSFTKTGVRARIQADILLDASRVQKKPVRDIGRVGTWIAKEIESGESRVKVYLPTYGNMLLGRANVPSIKMNIRNKHRNHVDFLTDLEPGDMAVMRRIANDWLDGRLSSILIKASASVPLKSGIIKLGTQTITQSLSFEGHDIPKLPEFEIEKLVFMDHGAPGQPSGMVSVASISIKNDYPLELDVPPLRFDILVPGCSPKGKMISLGEAKTDTTHIVPKEDVLVNVTGRIQQLPDALTSACPDSNSSPLDSLLKGYLEGKDTTIYVRGASNQDDATPKWLTNIIKDTTVPLPLPGHPFDNLIRNFSLADVHFSLPDPFANPGTPASRPKISAVVKALVGLPKEMNFQLDVDRVRADADVFYHGKKLGKLDLHKWQKAETSTIKHDGQAPELLIQSKVKNAPLQVTDDDVFTDVVQALVFGGKGVELSVEAAVDVSTVTALGKFMVREIPAKGKVFVKPIAGGGLSGFKPQIGDLQILDTSPSSIKLQAKVNVTNPTEYSAHVPYVNIHILHNDTLLGFAVAKDVDVKPGKNTNLVVEAMWSPSDMGGPNGSIVGRNLLSQYISGFNTTLTLKTHESTIPSQPALGRALSSLEVVIDTPDLLGRGKPNEGDDDGDDDDDDDDTPNGPHFIKDATMHLISSTATFILLSPLPHTTLYITSVSATAYYNHTEPVGTIDHTHQFAVPPGASQTPKLPVAWSLGGAGYDAVRDALGGTLKLDAKADVGVRVGQWQEKIWFVGGGIGASIRL